jgi:hypothetical protein
MPAGAPSNRSAKTMRILTLATLLPALALAQARPPPFAQFHPAQPGKGQTVQAAQPALPPPPSDAECAALPVVRAPYAFAPGEQLEFTLDAMGAEAGKLKMQVLPAQDGQWPVEATTSTNSFFSKVRKVIGTGTSYLDPRTLRPTRYVEDSTENDIHRTADVLFTPKDRSVGIAYRINNAPGHKTYHYAHDGLDTVGAIYAMRTLPMKEGMPLCFDAYGIRRLWRVWGKVEGKEHISLPLGEFDAWHLSGYAARVEDGGQRREIHIWISADSRRLPLVAVGAIDLGAVRATLSGFVRPGDSAQRAHGKRDLSW